MTPTATMPATTMALATSTETLDPPLGNWPGHATLPVSDAVMSVPRAPSFFIVRAGPSSVNNDSDLSVARVAKDEAFAKLRAQIASFAELTGRKIPVVVDP